MSKDAIQKKLLKEVAELDALPVGAYNIRSNGVSAARNTTASIDIVTKKDKPGIDIIIKPGTKNQSVHIPVIISESGLKEMVYNDFFIGEDCDVTIVAGCGISNCGGEDSRHMVLETSQIGGIHDTLRITKATLAENASIVIHDKILTEGEQQAKAEIAVAMNGDGGNCDLISRGVARGNSLQEVKIGIDGNAACHGHAECDSIIMDRGVIVATPQLKATCVDAELIHEAAIGKIAGEQLTKLMTMGLTEKEAEEMIIQGFLQ